MRGPLRRRHWQALLTLALIGVLAVPPTTPQASSPTGLQWWGEATPGKGFHLRIPVTVVNPHGFPVTDGTVLAQVDVGEKLIDAGWVHDAKGARDQLASFELDSASIRVVEMTDLKPPAPGTVQGRLKAYDLSRDSTDPLRYEVPSTHYPGFLQDAPPVPFDAKANPIVTVLWRVEGALAPGQARYFMVYFDSLTNSPPGVGHEEPDHRSMRGAHRLQTTFWSGPAMDLVGYSKPAAGTGFVRVLGLLDGTTVRVLTERPGGGFLDQVPPSGTHENPFLLDADQWINVNLGKEATNFRLVADRPILALVDSEGYVPARTGGFTGTDFLFATTYAPGSDQDGLFFYNRDPKQGRVVLQVQAFGTDGVANGPPTQVSLSDPQNPFPYTQGTHALPPSNDGSCTYPTGPTNPSFPSGGTYRARVVEGDGPIAIQYQPFNGVSQIPDLGSGGALGSDFWSPLSRSSGCPPQVQQYQFFAASLTDTQLEIANPFEADGRLHPPPCTTCPPGQPFGPGDSIELQTIATGLNDRPMAFTTGAPSWLMVGPNAQRSLSTVALHGPLGGGEAGRSFAGFGSARIFAPFEGTQVDARIDYATQTGVDVRMNLLKDRSTPLPERPGDVVLWYTLESNRPIVVLPQAASSGFLAGVPALLSAQLHEAEFRGYLVDIASVTGLSPVTDSTIPGGSVAYRFHVTNLARGANGASLTDTIELCAPKVPAGWKVEILGSTGCSDPAAIRRSDDKPVLVTMTVTAPETARPQDPPVAIDISAKSRSNPSVTDSVGTVTNIKRSFGVGVSFDAVRGADKVMTGLSEKEAAISAGQTAQYNVYVQNLGSVRDTFIVGLTPTVQGWDALVNGQDAIQVTLDPLGTKGDKDVAILKLQVLPPPPSQGLAEGILLTTVTAQSQSSPADLDRVTATTKLQAPSDLVLEANETTQWVNPGENATFELTLRNKGTGTVTGVRIDLQADSLPGWKGPTAFVRNVQTGRLIPIVEPLPIGPGAVVPLAIVATAAPDAAAGERIATRLHVSTPTQDAGLEAFLYAIVSPAHNITTHVEDGPTVRVELGGAKVPVKVRLSNGGNLDEGIRLDTVTLPPGWGIDLPAEDILLPRNHTQILEIAISVPNATAEGDYIVEVDLVSQDGNHTRLRLPVTVATFAQYGLAMPGTLAGQPNRPAQASIGLTNQGNTPITFSAQPSAGEPWALDNPATVEVPPGASVTWTLDWLVPGDAPDGATTHRIDLAARSGDAQVGTTQRIVTMDIAVGRSQLRIEDATAFRGAAGQIVRAVVTNEGQRPAFGVAVDLHVGGEAIDRVVIAKMDPGSMHNVTLFWPDGVVGAASVVVDAADSVVESDEVDNVAALAAAGTSKGASALPLGVALVAVALGARMRRRKEP